MEINNEEKIDGGKDKLNAVALLVVWQHTDKYKIIYFESYLLSYYKYLYILLITCFDKWSE